MKGMHLMAAGAGVLLSLSACTLKEVRSKSSGGPEFRHNQSSQTDNVRYYVGEGIELTWEDKEGRTYGTGVSYRYRTVDQGVGTIDNGVWLDFSIPLWTAPKKPSKDVVALERRIAELEKRLEAGSLPSGTPTTRAAGE